VSTVILDALRRQLTEQQPNSSHFSTYQPIDSHGNNNNAQQRLSSLPPAAPDHGHSDVDLTRMTDFSGSYLFRHSEENYGN
jgi:hypothetical protein